MRQSVVLLAKKISKEAVKATEKEIEVRAPWGKLAALSWGEASSPPVLLCPGRLDSCSSMRRLVQYLPQDFFYVAVDLPGNGRSDPLPRGARYMMWDFVPSLVAIREYFNWNQFLFIGHSMGSYTGKYYNMFYPGQMTRIVEIEPVAAFLPPFEDLDELRKWYLESYDQFYRDYDKNSVEVGTAPKYTYEEVLKLLMKARGLDQEVAEYVLERCLEPAGDGKFRITFDQRLKRMTQIPFSAKRFKKIFTATSVPIMTIFAKESVEIGMYRSYSFAMDESQWPNNNYKSVIVDGGHSVHLQNTEVVADLIIDFFGMNP